MADKYINADKLNEKIKTEQKNNANMGMSVIYDWFIETIKNEPNADVQPVKHGKWIAENQDKRGYADCFTCSNCNNYTYTYTLMKVCEHDYCPNCGARMDGEQND